MGHPAISVLLPAYNAERYIHQSIDSVLVQTFRDFELLVMDDGSTDRTAEIVKSYSDPRVKYIGRAHRGLVDTLNEGLDLACGKYIARMDADDLIVKTRLEKQFAFMESHLDYAVCFSSLKIFHYHPFFSVKLHYPKGHDEIRTEMFIRNPFPHATAMMRTEILRKDRFYFDPLFAEAAEDYDFFSRMSAKYRVYCLSESLYYYRKSPDQTTAKSSYKSHLHLEYETRRKIITTYFDLDECEIQVLLDVNNACVAKNVSARQALLSCFEKMQKQNIVKQAFSSESIKHFFCLTWLIFCSKNKALALFGRLRWYFSRREYVRLSYFFKLSGLLVFFKK